LSDGSFVGIARLRAELAVLRSIGPAAFGPDEYVGQQNFMGAGEITELVRPANLASGCRVLDICCGAGGATLHVAQTCGVRIVGVDQSEAAVRIGHERAAAQPDRCAEFLIGDATCLPVAGPFDAVLMFETFLVIRHKRPFLQNIHDLLPPCGAFVATAEAGLPLSAAEQALMPDGNSIWLIAEPELRALLDACGLRLQMMIDVSASHARVAARLAAAMRAEKDTIVHQLGRPVWQEILGVYEQWARWLADGRVRKLGFVAHRAA
jgi:cyclopropane fatty-acyl-phospholipid synthase-like methyltransferase